MDTQNKGENDDDDNNDDNDNNNNNNLLNVAIEWLEFFIRTRNVANSAVSLEAWCLAMTMTK
jgi:hypothetical protein